MPQSRIKKNSEGQKTQVENLTKDDLPKPLSTLSDTEKKKIQTEFESALDSVTLSPKTKERMAKRVKAQRTEKSPLMKILHKTLLCDL